MNTTHNNTFETEFRQRAFDGRWERLVKVMDYENKYSYTTEGGYKVTFIPERWETAGVYDFIADLEE
jgi:hypothetical protein